MKKIYLTLSSLFLVVFYQNCGGALESNSEALNSATEASRLITSNKAGLHCEHPRGNQCQPGCVFVKERESTACLIRPNERLCATTTIPDHCTIAALDHYSPGFENSRNNSCPSFTSSYVLHPDTNRANRAVRTGGATSIHNCLPKPRISIHPGAVSCRNPGGSLTRSLGRYETFTICMRYALIEGQDAIFTACADSNKSPTACLRSQYFGHNFLIDNGWSFEDRRGTRTYSLQMALADFGLQKGDYLQIRSRIVFPDFDGFSRSDGSIRIKVR